MNKIIIRNRFDDSVIYQHECENNTIKITVEKAVKEKVSLSNADLSNADLRNADLSNADLSYVDLSNVDLRNAYLSNAYLSDAYLPIYCKWSNCIIGDKIKIGCKVFTIEEGVDFFENSTEEYETKRDTQDFKQIKAVFYAYKAYLEVLNYEK